MRRITVPLVVSVLSSILVACATTAPAETSEVTDNAVSAQPTPCTTSSECPSAAPMCCVHVGVLGAIFGQPGAVVATCAASCPANHDRNPETGQPSLSAKSCETKADCVGYSEVESDGPHALSACCAAAVAPSQTLCMDPAIEHGGFFQGTFECPAAIN